MCPTSRRMVRRRGARASGVFWLIGVRRRALDAPTVLRLARLPEVAMLPAAEVAAAVGRDDAGTHGVLHARVDGAGVAAIRVRPPVGHGDELRRLGGHQRDERGFPCPLAYRVSDAD